MAEAQKMMSNKEWQKEMEKMQKSKEFKEATLKTKEMMADPNQAAAAEAKVEHMVKVGDDMIKADAEKEMEEALLSMSDPGVLEKITEMLKDPNFANSLLEMTRNPDFAVYKDTMAKLMADPEKRQAIQQNIGKIKEKL